LPASEYLLKSLDAFPAIRAAAQQILASVASGGIAAARHDDAGPIAIHPGAGSPEKCWPIDSYLRLIDLIHADARQCKILLGEVELERWPTADIRRLESATDAAHPTTYIDLLSELSHSSAFVGNDSGPGHLSGILGLPTTILFGPTDPAIWKPLGPCVTALRHEPFAQLPVEDVYKSVVKSLGKSIRLAPVADE
jgi:heptosyltransferase-3